MYLRRKIQFILPKLLLAPTIVSMLLFTYAFVGYTFYLSLTDSRILPSHRFIGFGNYADIWLLRNWLGAVANLLSFSLLFIGIGCALGLFLAILLDQKLRGLSRFSTLFAYPMAMSFIVVGIVWKWIFDPAVGLEDALQLKGWDSFALNWIKDRNYAIYCVVIAALWQATGIVMVLFLAGINRIDRDIIKSAQIDGATTSTIYLRIVLPSLRPMFFAVFAFLGFIAIRTYDLVVALTGGGPGRATELPATFMYSYTYSRNQMAMGATSAIMIASFALLIIIPVVAVKLRSRGQ